MVASVVLFAVVLFGTTAFDPCMGRQLQHAPVPEVVVDGWIEGRATWYNSPWVGACGYGRLDHYQFGYDAIAAMANVSATSSTHSDVQKSTSISRNAFLLLVDTQVMPEYPGSCGRCFEIKCRGFQAVSADGSINLNRYNACYDTNHSIIIKVTDTCPCDGNANWCCGDMPHFDLGIDAFSRLASAGQGIIGLYYRSVPCEAVDHNGSYTTAQEQELQKDLGELGWLCK